jgi:putative ABC transport system permease protein
MNVDEDFGRKHLEEVRQAEAEKKQAAAAVAASDPTPRLPSAMSAELVIDAKRAAAVKIGEALQSIADRNMGEQQPVNAQGTWSVGATMFGPSVRISTPDEVGVRILARASGMIWASCYLPLITCLLSLGFGVFSGWCGTGISQYVSFFGGLAPPLVIPWPQLAFGFSVTLGRCLAAALWPAVSTGRTEPLKLLQAGRAAM